MVFINPILKNIYKKIKKYDNIVLARHIGPDPDALASTIALRDSIKETFSNKNVFAVGAGLSKFKCFGNLDKMPKLEKENTLLIALDVPNISRLDGVNIDDYNETVKIDHHPFEDKMGEVELIDESACSTCQLVLELIFATKLALTEKIAENLYVGIVADSERFMFKTTTSKTFLLVSKLLQTFDLDLNNLYKELYDRPLAEARFQGFLIQNLEVNESGMAYIKISQKDIDKFNVDTASASNMINSFNYIKELLVWVFVTYDNRNDLYKLNIRSRGPIINEIASKYNGGGHPFASGCRISKIEEVDKCLNELDVLCQKFKESQNENSEI